MTDERLYRFHWLEEKRGRSAIRWRDHRGSAASAREEALTTAERSADGAIRVSLLTASRAPGRFVLTSRSGIQSWRPSQALPPSAPNAWADRLERERCRQSAASAVRTRLQAASEAGLIDAAGAARVAAALDLALIEKAAIRTE
ncbi:hypothetical protein [Sphingomonas corticis]|uniref:Uncharacterized protein n=1 Tax=Sphingomonas corticis TaxID=2722791 RepID=A0ABX1CQ31_9SPHN|nr:hypothetical protein [Sphingomonas corticis]NJR80052.1 hypothetical protein [Sphingomonas corticis]